MKKTLLLSVLIASAVTLMAQEQKEVMTGASYVNDVYYNLENGIDTIVARENWDLGFTTSNFSISILANTAAGVEVYTYPMGDTADWETLDTTGMEWSSLYNSIETFDEGAFSAHATEHPDYGWGIYNDFTHMITGDSLFVIKTVSGTYKKLDIILRNPMANTWEFKYANLDGTDEKSELLTLGEYNAKSFVYYSIDNQEMVDREPAKDSWDLLFTRYWDYTIPYLVSGVLTNENHMVAQEVKEEGLDQSTFVSYDEAAFSPDISILGSDWKSFNMGTFTYDVDTTTVFFLKKYGETDSTYYKLYFTGFDYTVGKYTLMQEELSLVSAPGPGLIQLLEVYPNPASEYLNVVFDHAGETTLQIMDMTGRMVHSRLIKAGGLTSLTLDINDLKPGLFFLRVDTGAETGVLRFIKE